MVDSEKALAHALKLVDEGADIIDIGGESTRPAAVYPGAKPIDAETELKRVMPAMRLLASEIKVPISIDTYKASVASAAIEAGASMVNDVWGLMADPDMARVVAEAKVPVILMHNQNQAKYVNVVADVIRSLRQRVTAALDAGITRERIVVDPGIGFGKTKEHNLEILKRLDELKVLGRPILLGTSRKILIGQTTSMPPEQRIEGTAATVALGIAKGADIVRVHDVREIARAVRVTDAIVRGTSQS
jgi:dihydropteroate synthase